MLLPSAEMKRFLSSFCTVVYTRWLVSPLFGRLAREKETGEKTREAITLQREIMVVFKVLSNNFV